MATTYEAGWRFHRIRSGGSGVDAGASVYDTDVEDDIYFVAPTATTGYFQNLRATRRAGLELSASLLTRGLWRVYANYGFTAATFQSAAVLATARDSGSEQVLPGDRLPLVPRHRINVGVSVPAAAPGLRITGDVRYVGRQVLRGDEANVTARLPDYGVVDASLLYTHSRYDARVTVRNLLDRRYVSFGTFAANPAAPGAPVQRFLTPGLPRNLEVSLSRVL